MGMIYGWIVGLATGSLWTLIILQWAGEIDW